MALTESLTADRLKECLNYDPATGLFTSHQWLDKRGRSCGGRIAGCEKDGYIVIRIDYVLYRAHRLAWLYMTGAWPAGEIDHINMVRSDNRWLNLRNATQSQNNFNRKVYSRNKIGVKGVCFDAARQKYLAQIRKDGKGYHLGRFDTIEEASAAYVRAATLLHGSFARVQ